MLPWFSATENAGEPLQQSRWSRRPAHLHIREERNRSPFTFEKSNPVIDAQPQIHERLPTVVGLLQQSRQQEVGAAGWSQPGVAETEHEESRPKGTEITDDKSGQLAVGESAGKHQAAGEAAR